MRCEAQLLKFGLVLRTPIRRSGNPILNGASLVLTKFISIIKQATQPQKVRLPQAKFPVFLACAVTIFQHPSYLFALFSFQNRNLIISLILILSMPIDTTYSFFPSPQFETTPTFPRHKAVAKRSSRLSHPELTVLYHGTTESTAIEEWTTDATYGFFSSPSLNPEPIHRERKQISRPSSLDEDRKPAPVYEGYSFFGI
jgi:hypothetical protein